MYQLRDISNILGKSEKNVKENLESLEIEPIQKSTLGRAIKFYYSQRQLDIIKSHFLGKFASSFNYVPDVNRKSAFKNEIDEFEVLMEEALTLPNTWFIFRSSKEQVEISLSGSKELISTHLLTHSERKFIELNFPNLPIESYKLRNKIYQ